MTIDVSSFVSQCQHSSQSAYDAFKELLNGLESPRRRAESLQFLFALSDYWDEKAPKDCHFQFLNQRILDAEDQTTSLRLLQFPSTFLPEAWSFTFYEGLIRYPQSEYQNKKVVELGCGIGWITIALALRYLPDSICGLDINPKAIVCARLNLYLNAFHSDGTAKRLANGLDLVDCVSFYESNLFSHFEAQAAVQLDRIIGCIPQVLNPEPEVMENLIAESASDEYLHSLSNYFAKQGFIEDQFGLGLIASAVEQSVPLLKSNGKLILNLGGRPGRSVLERLMQRRGFKVRRVWQTQVEQAADTEIDALVDIEKNTGHRFEFYMSANADTPIDATTALEYAKAGGQIFHSVDVYEAKMLFPQQVKSIYQSVDQMGGKALRSAVDLTYENYDDAEERYSFLAFLARQMQKVDHFPYAETAGLSYFRQQLAEYFRYYLRVDLAEKDMLITPGRRELVDGLLSNYRPALTLVEKSLGSLVDSQLAGDKGQILHVPPQVEYMIELTRKLKPQLVVTKLDPHEIQSSQLVEQLIQCAVEANSLLVLDLTDNIDLSSRPVIHGVYRYLSQHHLPKNIVLMAALVNNRVYQNYSLNFTLTNNPQLTKELSDAAELSYSRTPFLKQLYYGHLLEELLYFQRTRSTSLFESDRNETASFKPMPLCDSARQAFSHPAITGNHLAFNNETVRLDYGENELATPRLLKEALFESYLVRKCVADESSPDEPLRKMLARRFKIPKNLYSKIVYGNGVAPIYNALLKLCARDGKSLIIPSGSYGYFKAAAIFKGLSLAELETQESDQFKITPDGLQKCLVAHPASWLFLNAPINNPTGAIYTQKEITELIKIAAEHDVTLVMDCVFSGLEFDESLAWDLSQNFHQISHSQNSRLVIMGGISKEFAAGGLRFGFSWSTSKALLLALENELPHVPHFTLGYAVRKLLAAQYAGDVGLVAHQQEQIRLLSSRAKKLTALLQAKGWRVIQPEGGLFLVAKPEKFMQENDLSPTEAGDLITRRLFDSQNLVINNSTWTGLPGYCRFVLSGSQSDFEQALNRLEQFVP